MGWFSAFSKENKSSTTNQTTNNYTDQSANAGGDNSLAVGSNATVNIQNLDEQVARTAIAAGVNQTDRAFTTAEKLTEFTTNTIKGLAESSARENAATRNSADLSLKTTAGLVGMLQQQTSDALAKAQQPEAASVATLLKPVLYIVGAIVAIVLIVSFKGKGSK